MADKSILEVEIDDTAFKAFQQKFDAYKDACKKIPEAWGETTRQAGDLSSGFGAMVSKMAEAQAAIGNLAGKSREVGGEQSLAVDAWGRINYGAKQFAGHISSATFSLAKWTGLTTLFSSIVAGGGLMGIGRMASGVGSRRTSAMGMGLDYGEARSFDTNFARLGNAQGLLAGFNSAMTNGEGQAPLVSLLGANAGSRMAGKDAAGLFAEALPDIKRLVDQTDPRLLDNVLKARGLDRLGVDLNTAMIIRRMSPGEINDMISGFYSDIGSMSLSPENQRRWQEFETQLRLAGDEIENTFAKNLVNITPGVMRLSNAVAGIVDTLLNDGGVADKSLTRINSWAKSFSEYLDSPSFEEAIVSFTDSMTRFGSILSKMGRGNGQGDNGGTGAHHSIPTNGGNRGPTTPGGSGGNGRGNGGSTGGGGSLTTGRRAGAGGVTPGGDASVQTPDRSPWLPNSGDGHVGTRPGRHPDIKHLDPKLVELFNAGAAHLPPGYKALISEGYNPNGHAPGSMHHKSGQGAIDFVIVGPDGRELNNNGGNDPTGVYTKMHRDMEGEMAARYPDLAARHAMGHGPDFETSRGSGRADWMHVDLGGARGSGMGHTRIDHQGPVPGEHYGTSPIAQVGKQNTVTIENHGDGDISTQSHQTGPMQPKENEAWRVPH